MSSGVVARRLPVIVTVVVAFILTAMPLADWAEPFRPAWITLACIYWAMMLPNTWSVGSAWIAGLILDVMHGSILGQNALALCFVVFVTVRIHLLMRVFPTLQLTATVFALMALFQFLLFWINGVAGIDVEPVSYWGPVISSTLLWPIVASVLNGVRLRAAMR